MPEILLKEVRPLLYFKWALILIPSGCSDLYLPLPQDPQVIASRYKLQGPFPRIDCRSLEGMRVVK